MRKTSFNSKTHPEHSAASRSFDRLLMSEKAIVSNCHKPGHTIFVDDILSRDTHLPINVLKFAILTLFPSQVPDSLEVVDLKKEIDSDLASLMHLMPKPTASIASIKQSSVGALLAGSDSSKEMASTILGLKHSTKESASSCCQLSQKVLEEMSSAHEHSSISELTLLTPPLAIYVRPFGRTFGTTLE